MPAASVHFAGAVITLRYGAVEVPALRCCQQENLSHWLVLKSTKRGSAGAQRAMNEHEFKSVNDLNEEHRGIGTVLYKIFSVLLAEAFCIIMIR